MRAAEKLFAPTHERVRSTKRRRSGRRQRRGVALVMVLVITTIMGAVAADLENSAQVNLKAAANARDQLQAHFHARSALELELFVLRFQSQIKQTLAQFIPIPLFELSGVLVSADTLKGIFTEEDKREELERLATVEDEDPFGLTEEFGDFRGTFWIEDVVDENRKIDINSTSFGVGCQNLMHLMLGAVFDDPKYDILFEHLGESRDPIRNRVEIISSISDWTDGNETVDSVCIITGDDSQTGAAEEGRYRNLPYNAHYEPKNGMFNSLAELRMIPHVNDAFMRIFSKYLTVWGSGEGINMLTAEPWMYQAVIRSVMDRPWVPQDVERFREFETEKALLMAVPGAQIKPPMMLELMRAAGFPINEARFNELVQRNVLRFEDVASVFRITAVGQVGDATSRLTVVWRDNRAQGELRYWRED
jgi:type II secretory pathway component PulK